MNISIYNFRYYTQDQLDHYILEYRKVNDNYLLLNEAAEYVHTTIYKIMLLRDLRFLYPQAINSELYYLKSQLEECLRKGLFNAYLTTKETAKYIGMTDAALRGRNDIEPIYIKQFRFYSKQQLDDYLQQQNYINTLFTREEAAKYLHMSLATLDRRKEDEVLLSKIGNCLYSKEQLDDYLRKHEVNGFQDLLTINDIMNKYNFTRKRIENWLYRGRLTAKLINNKYYIDKNELEQCMEKNLPPENKDFVPRGKILKEFNISQGQLRALYEKGQIKIIRTNQ